VVELKQRDKVEPPPAPSQPATLGAFYSAAKNGNPKVAAKLGAESMPGVTAGITPLAVTNTVRNSGPRVVHGRRPVMHRGMKRIAICVEHREPMFTQSGDAAGAYIVQSFALNPGNASIGPWAARLAPEYDMYFYERSTVEFITEAPTTLQGVAGIMYDPEATDPPPADRTTFEEQARSVTSVVYKNFKNTLFTPMTTRASWYFVDDAASADADGRVTNQAEMNLMIVDTNSAAVLGRWWHSYRLWLMEPTMSNPGAGLSTAAAFSARSGSGGDGVGQLGSIIVDQMITGSSSDLHSSIPGVGPVLPGSNAAFGLTASPTAPSSALCNFRVLLPFSASSTTAVGRPIAGSYILIITVRLKSASTGLLSITKTLPSAAVSWHVQPLWNGAGTAFGAASPPSAAGGIFVDVSRCDVAGTAANFTYTSSTNSIGQRVDWLAAPSVDVAITNTVVSEYRTVEVTVVPVGVASGGGLMQPNVKIVNDGKNVTLSDTITMRSIDGLVNDVKSITFPSTADPTTQAQVVKARRHELERAITTAKPTASMPPWTAQSIKPDEKVVVIDDFVQVSRNGSLKLARIHAGYDAKS
jgi:hypothetical protein